MKGVGLVEQGSRKCFRVFRDGYLGHQGRWPSKIRDLTEIRLRALAFENTSRKVKVPISACVYGWWAWLL